MVVIDHGTAGLRAGRPALGRLVADVEDFAARTWGSHPALHRADELPGDVDDLFSEDAVDELVSRRGLRTPFLRVARDGETLAARAFTSGGGTGAGIADQLDDSKLSALFAEGSTLVLQALHRTYAPVTTFTQQLAADLGHPVQVNAYVTPPQSRGFDDHYDVHDVFVLQVAGRKRWRIHAPVHEAPLRDQPWTDRRDEVAAAARTEPLIDEVLEPGDCLYLPRGTLHAATALGDVSTHLTFGVHPWHGHHVATELGSAALAALVEDPEVRASLPLGVDLSRTDDVRERAELVRAALLRAVESVPVDTIVAALTAQDRASSRPAPVGPLAQLRAARALVGADLVRLRDHVAATVDGTTLRSRAGSTDVATLDPTVLAQLTGGEGVRAESLGLDVAKEWVGRGILVAVGRR